MSMPMFAIRMPTTLVQDLKKISFSETVKRGQLITWSRLLRETAEKLVNERNGKKQ